MKTCTFNILTSVLLSKSKVWSQEREGKDADVKRSVKGKTDQKGRERDRHIDTYTEIASKRDRQGER